MSRHATGKWDKYSEQRRLHPPPPPGMATEFWWRHSGWSSALLVLCSRLVTLVYRWEGNLVGPVPLAAAQPGVLKCFPRCVFRGNNHCPFLRSRRPGAGARVCQRLLPAAARRSCARLRSGALPR